MPATLSGLTQSVGVPCSQANILQDVAGAAHVVQRIAAAWGHCTSCARVPSFWSPAGEQGDAPELLAMRGDA